MDKADKRSILFKEFARGADSDSQPKVKPGCVIYTRVSSKSQHDTNHSLETQLSAILRYVEKHQLKIVKQFGNTYESAKNDSERKEFQKMITFAKKHKNEIGQILVYSFDRWSRSGISGAHLAAELKKLGIQLISVSQPTDLNNPSGDLMKNILLIFSSHDNALRREKCIVGTKNRLEKGLPSGTPPTGYSAVKKDGEKIVVPNGDARFIKKIFDLKVHDQKTNNEIAKIVNNLGFDVYPRSISKFLSNPFYAGYIVNKLLDGRVVRGLHKSLVSETLFLKANSQNKRLDFRIRKTDINPQLPLKNMIWCEGCNRGHLTGYLSKKLNIWYYKCSRKNCKTNRRADIIHDQFKQLLSHYSIPKGLGPLLKEELGKIYSSLNKQEQLDTDFVQKELDSINNKLSRADEKFINDEITKEVYDSFIQKLVKKKVQLENAMKSNVAGGKTNLDEFVEFAIKLSQDLISIWDLGDVHTKVKLAKLVFPIGVQYDRKRDNIQTVTVNDALVTIKNLADTIGDHEAFVEGAIQLQGCQARNMVDELEVT